MIKVTRKLKKDNSSPGKDIQELAEAAARYNKCAQTYRELRIINKCLPKKKEKIFDALTTKAFIAFRNAQSHYLKVEKRVGHKVRV